MERKELPNMENEAGYLEEATRFVNENIVDAVDGFVCVDGRYQNNGEQKGFLARAGGHLGIVMGLIGLRDGGIINMTDEECFDTVYNFVTKDGGPFYAHTDEHSIEKKAPTGCGHAGRAADSETSSNYGVNADDIEKVLLYMRDNDQHPNVVEVVLTGNHREKGLLKIKGLKKTLQHQDESASYFVYDKDRDDEFVKNFVEQNNIKGLNVDVFIQMLEKQTNATLQILAPNDPMFEVDLTNDEAQLKFTGLVPPLAA